MHGPTRKSKDRRQLERLFCEEDELKWSSQQETNLDKQNHSLYHGQSNFDGRVAVKESHVVGDLEDVHEKAEAQQQESS